MVKFFIDSKGRVRKINDNDLEIFKQMKGITMELEVNRAKRAGVSKRELFERDIFDRKLGSLSSSDREIVMTGIGSGRIQIGDIVEGATKKNVTSAKALDDALENISAARALRLNPEAKRQFIKENALRRT